MAGAMYHKGTGLIYGGGCGIICDGDVKYLLGYLVFYCSRQRYYVGGGFLVSR